MESETAVVGGGCFWCTEAVFKMLKGVRSVEPGYAGPSTRSGQAVTYEEVSSGLTPYVEVIKIEYDPDKLAFEEVLRVFFASHDATQLNRQGNDIGPQYASVIFYTTPRQKEKAEHYISVLQNGENGKPIVTRVEPLITFYPAEDYHKNYFENHKDASYCELIIEPKVEKVQKKFAHLVKDGKNA